MLELAWLRQVHGERVNSQGDSALRRFGKRILDGLGFAGLSSGGFVMTVCRALVASVMTLAAFAAVVVAGTNAARDHDSEHGAHFLKCARVCAECQLQCDSCFTHCRIMLENGNKEHAKTAQTCADCAECCKLAATLTARFSPFSVAACECCAKCCDECAAACEKMPNDKHMAECAKSCRDCAKSCRDMVGMMQK